jgi:hypothetical protein
VWAHGPTDLGGLNTYFRTLTKTLSLDCQKALDATSKTFNLSELTPKQEL